MKRRDILSLFSLSPGGKRTHLIAGLGNSQQLAKEFGARNLPLFMTFATYSYNGDGSGLKAGKGKVVSCH